jgi:pimeloyl-ACP methyl ester carboxylesterase
MNPLPHFVDARDGLRLAVYELGPVDGPTLVCVPGLFSNHTVWLGTRGVGLGRAAAEAGYRVITYDPRGHGASERLLGYDRWRFEDWWRYDLPAVLDYACRTQQRGAPRTLRGPQGSVGGGLQAASAPRLGEGSLQVVAHSAGGAALLCALADDGALQTQVRSICLLATPAPLRRLPRYAFAMSASLLAQGLGAFPSRRCRLGSEDEPPQVMAQWMRWNLPGGWLADDGRDMLARCATVSTPYLALAGVGDTLWAPPEACWALLQKSGAGLRRFQSYGRSSGYQLDYGHATLLTSAAARREVWPQVLGWLSQHLRPSSAG